MPRRHGLADAEGIADREHAVADLDLVAVGEGDRRQVLGVDLDDGDVGLRVAADDLGRQLAAVVERDRDRLGAVDHVVVGHDVAVGADDDAGAEAALGRPPGRGWQAVAEELAKVGSIRPGNGFPSPPWLSHHLARLHLDGDLDDARGDRLPREAA